MGEGLREGEDEAVVAAGAVEMTDAVLLMAEPRVVPVKLMPETLVLVRGKTGFTVIVVGVLLVIRLAVLGTRVVVGEKIALIGVLIF